MKMLMVFAVSAALHLAQAQEPGHLWRADKTVPLGKVEGRIDHLAADVAGQRLFVAALENNTVEVVDLKTGTKIRSLSGFTEPQGIAYTPEFDRLFVANGRSGTCLILDGHSFRNVASIQVGEDADNVRYDQKLKRIYIGYGSGALGVFDASTGKKTADIPLSGHPESFCLASTSPDLFVNVPQANHIAVIDRNQTAVTAAWPLQNAKANFPMALDEAHHRLFVGCRDPAAILVYDSSAGRPVASVSIAGDTDDLFYDGDRKRLYVSCGGGAIEVIQQTDADHYAKLQTVPTPAGARTSLFIPELKVFCLAVPHRGSQPAEIRVFNTH